MPHLHITSEPDAPDEQRALLSDAIHANDIAAAGDTAGPPIVLFLRDEAGAIRGGLLGDVWGGGAHLDILWVDESLRGQGYGSALLAMAEDEARAQGCHFIFLDSHSYEAPDFYRRHGYEVFGVLDDYPQGYQCYFLKKVL